MVGGLQSVRGYIDKEEWYENRIFADFLLFGKILVYRKLLWKEDVPLWAVIKRSTMGYSGWQSKRPNLIDASAEGRLIKTINFF